MILAKEEMQRMDGELEAAGEAPAVRELFARFVAAVPDWKAATGAAVALRGEVHFQTPASGAGSAADCVTLIAHLAGPRAGDAASFMSRSDVMRLIRSVSDSSGQIDVPKLQQLLLERTAS